MYDIKIWKDQLEWGLSSSWKSFLKLGKEKQAIGCALSSRFKHFVTNSLCGVAEYFDGYEKTKWFISQN